MKKSKIIFIIFILLFVTGCGNVSYDLDIRVKNIYENLEIESSSLMQSEDLGSLIVGNLNNYPPTEIANVTYEVNGNKANIYNNFKDIKNLSNNRFINVLYNKIEIKFKENTTNLIFSEYNPTIFECGEFDEDCSLVLDKITVNLVSEYEIIDSNADLIDKNKNKHTWILDAGSDNIYISYSDKILWNIVIKNFINENYDKIILGIVCLGILLSLTVVLIKFLKAMKENNS